MYSWIGVTSSCSALLFFRQRLINVTVFELIPLAPVKLEKHLHSARSEEGRLYYDGEWYIRGQTICIDKKDECPTR